MHISNSQNNKVVAGNAYFDDNITNYGDNVIIYGYGGNDSILNGFGVNNATILGGAGNDTINNYSTIGGNKLYIYDAGGGNDVIMGYGFNDVLQINENFYTPQISGNDKIIRTQSGGSITLKNCAYTYVKIVNAYGNLTTYNNTAVTVPTVTNYDDAEYITNTIAGAAVYGYGGNDTIINGANNVYISGGAGNDVIGSMGNKVSITGDIGNDYIESYGNNAVIVGVTGNDTIFVQGTGNTLDSGQGSDLIILDTLTSGNLIAYANGGGNDSVVGLSSSYTIKLTGNGVSKVSVNGSNVTATVGNSTITGINVKGKKLNVIGADGKKYSVVVNATNSVTQFATSYTTANETLDSAIKNFDASARTKAIKLDCVSDFV